MSEPTEGKKAPAFKAKSSTGETVTLKDLEGTNVVLYFYPRDDTPGCTKEACGFRDNLKRIEKHGATVFGVSRDDLASHEKFVNKYELNFPLLSDDKGKITEAYGGWNEKNMYGKKSMGSERSTFLIDGEGKIRKVWRRVRVDGHVDKVIEALNELE